MQNILLIDDDKDIYSFFKAALNPSIQIDYCNSLAEAKFKIETDQYNLIVLDIYFDKEKSTDLLLELKLKQPEILKKIIMITGSSGIDDEISVHEFGVLDFIKKPLNYKLLKVVIEKHLFNIDHTTTNNMFIKPFFVNLNNQEITLELPKQDEKKLDLTLKEYKLLKLFIENPGITLSREKIMDRVWDETSESLTRTVDMHVSMLRKKIAPYSELLETKRGIGYILKI